MTQPPSPPNPPSPGSRPPDPPKNSSASIPPDAAPHPDGSRRPAASNKPAPGKTQNQGQRPEGSSKSSQLETFIQRAAPIIAAERGLSEGARVKLRSIAQDMKLPDEMFDEGIDTLQRDPPSLQKALTKYERAFQKSMRVKLQGIPRGILTAKIENRAVEVGTKKYQLSELQSREILRELVTELGLKRISLTQSEAHMEATIEDLIGDGTYASPKTRARLVEFGKGWGLSTERVEVMIQSYIDSNLHGLKSEGKFLKLLISGGFIFVALLIGGTAYLLSGNRQDTEIVTPDNETELKIDPIADAAADFWDEGTKLAAVKLKLSFPRFKDWQPMLVDDDPAQRMVGYQEMIDGIDVITANAQQKQRTTAFLQRLIQLEPDPSNARSLVNGLIQQTKLTAARLPINESFVAHGRWTIDLLAGTMLDNETSPEVNRMIGEELFQVTGLSDQAGTVRTIKQNFLGAFFEAQLSKLSDFVTEKPAATIAAYATISERATMISDSRLYRLHVDFIRSALNPAGEDWRGLAPLMRACVSHVQTDQFVQLIDVYESATNENAQRELGSLLVDVIEVTGGSTPREIARQLRNKLGIAEPIRVGIRHQQQQFAADVKTFVRSIVFDRVSDEKLADQIAAVSYWSTMATFYDRGDLKSENYLDLKKLGPPSKLDQAYVKQLLGDGEEREIKATPRELPDSVNRSRIDRMLKTLGKEHKVYSTQKRVTSLRELSIFAKHIPDVRLSVASGFATYVFSEKKDTEQLEVVAALRNFREWPSFLVAAADQFPASKLPLKELAAIAAELLNEVPVNSNRDEWLNETRIALLQAALERFNTVQPVVPPSKSEVVFQRLEKVCIAFTRQRAINMGARRVDAESARDMRDLFTQWYIARKIRFSRDAENAQLAARRDIESTTYLATNPMQVIVLLQQLIVDDLALQKESQSALQAKRITEINRQLAERNRSARHIAQQMLNNEVAILELLSIVPE